MGSPYDTEESMDRRRTVVRSVLFMIILGTLPLYILGFVLWGTASDSNAQDSGDVTQQPLITNTPLGQGEVSATTTLRPTSTPISTLPPLLNTPNQSFPTAAFFPTNTPVIFIPTSTTAPTLTPFPTNTIVPTNTTVPQATLTPLPPPSDTPVPAAPPVDGPPPGGDSSGGSTGGGAPGDNPPPPSGGGSGPGG
ncbi:MAG: hypothetical protein RLP44_20395 [Aggregatilineales bacterium]